MAALTETLKTKHCTFECEVIELESLYPVSKDMLGTRPDEKDYDRLLTGNTLVYLDGKRVVAFLKGAFTEVTKIEPGTESYNYWRWVSRDLHSDQRGLVGGKDIVTETAFRLTNGQMAFFRQVAKGKVTTLEEVEKNPGSQPRSFTDLHLY